MWPKDILKCIPSLLEKAKAPEHFVLFITKILKPKWNTELFTVTSLLDFRDYAEDSWKQNASALIGPQEEPRFDLLVKELKALIDPAKRRMLVQCFLEENLQKHRASALYENQTFVEFALDQELDLFFKLSEPLIRFRPLLKSSRESIEQVMSQMNNQNTFEQLNEFKAFLGLDNLWPVLALWRAHYFGESEELFLHAPMPRVFGAPCTQYKDVDRQCDFNSIAKPARINFSFQNLVIAGNSTLAYKIKGQWTQRKLKQAHLVCGMPGLSNKIWLLDPKTMSSCIYDVETSKAILEFDLPGTEDQPNWIDCQRDVEGSLVLIWSKLNNITGSSSHENMVALDEELLNTGQGEFLQQISVVPQRRFRGTRLDFRDHGNLVHVQHSVKDSQGPLKRIWTHNYDIIFANSLLMTLETESRPIEAVYGTPFDIVLLSPLSSTQALQHWRLGPDKKFFLCDSSSVPKTSTEYQSMSIYY